MNIAAPVIDTQTEDIEMKALLAAATLALPLAVPPGVYRHDADPQRFIDLAADPAFQAVGRIRVRSEQRWSGSFILIRPDRVLTAAHVVEGHAPGDLVVELDGRPRAVTAIVIHPDYKSERFAGNEEAVFRKGIDLAILTLDRPIEDVPPARLYRGDGEVGKTGTLVGYGTSGDAMTAITHPIPTGTKRAGNNMIDAAGGTVEGRPIPDWYLISDFDHPTNPHLNRTGAAKPVPLEYLAVGGDSGGGLFIHEDDWYLAGVFATGRIAINDSVEQDGLYGSLDMATRVSRFLSWIDATADG